MCWVRQSFPRVGIEDARVISSYFFDGYFGILGNYNVMCVRWLCSREQVRTVGYFLKAENQRLLLREESNSPLSTLNEHRHCKELFLLVEMASTRGSQVALPMFWLLDECDVAQPEASAVAFFDSNFLVRIRGTHLTVYDLTNLTN